MALFRAHLPGLPPVTPMFSHISPAPHGTREALVQFCLPSVLCLGSESASLTPRVVDTESLIECRAWLCCGVQSGLTYS